MSEAFDTIESALEDIKAGKIVIVVDDEDRENEGDFVMAAQGVSAEAINFMAQNGRGIICAPITAERAQQLQLDLMVRGNTSHYDTPFTVSIDLKQGNSTGISCADRARTILALIDPKTRPEDFMRPGHIFPLIARERGVLQRNGHTEAAVDLARLAGLSPAGVICEIMNPDGTMARLPQLQEMAKRWNLKLISIKDLIQYRQIHSILLAGKINLPTQFGEFKLHIFETTDNGSGPAQHHIALIKGIPEDQSSITGPVLVRLHSECLTGDLFGSKRCDCGEQLHKALAMMEQAGQGVLVYLRQEGRGIGLVNKIRAYELQERGLDTVDANHALGFEADLRDYSLAAQILRQLGVSQVRLLTNNPQKIYQFQHSDHIQVVERVPLEVEANEANIKYLTTKRDKLGHLILRNLL